MKDKETQKLIDAVMDQNSIHYAYNETFSTWHPYPMTKAACVEFVKNMNQCKGGRWAVGSKIEFDEWNETKEFFKKLK